MLVPIVEAMEGISHMDPPNAMPESTMVDFGFARILLGNMNGPCGPLTYGGGRTVLRGSAEYMSLFHHFFELMFQITVNGNLVGIGQVQNLPPLSDTVVTVAAGPIVSASAAPVPTGMLV